MNHTHEAPLSRRAFARNIGLGALGVATLPLLPLGAEDNKDASFAITHGPVVQSPGPGEVTVTWHTNRETS